MINHSTVMPHYRQIPGQTGTGMGMPGQLPLFPPSSAIGTTLPTGLPLGPTFTPIQVPPSALPPTTQFPSAAQIPTAGQLPPVPTTGITPQTLQDTYYTAGFLRTQIGRNVRVEFLIGTTGPLIDRIGTLLGVGASYILLRPVDSDDVLLCDLYSIKFVTILL